MKARRLRVVGTEVDWILEVKEGEDADSVIAVVNTGENVDKYPYNEVFEFEKGIKDLRDGE